MSKTALGLLPFAAGLAVFSLVVWYLVGQGSALATWLVAAFLLAHGLVQLVFLVPQPASTTTAAGGIAWPFDMTKSWLITRLTLGPAVVRAIGTALLVVIAGGFTLAALATVGWLVPASWWAPLVVIPSVASIVLLVAFFSPSLILGLVIDAVLLWLALASGWLPQG
jgi:hypothetical protein